METDFSVGHSLQFWFEIGGGGGSPEPEPSPTVGQFVTITTPVSTLGITAIGTMEVED